MPVARRPGCGAEVLIANLPVAVVPGAPFGTFGAWTAIGTPANDLFLTRLQARRLGIPSSGGNNAIEFAYGAAPTPIDVIRQIFSINDPAPGNDVGYLAADLNTWNPKVPAGQSLQARVSDAVAAGPNWECWACGWDAAVPLFTALPASSPAGGGRYYPSNTGQLLPMSGISPAYGAWLTVVDPAPNDLLVVAVHHSWSLGNFIATGTAYQLAIGAAGAEVAVGTFLQGHATDTTNIDPPVWVKAGERLAIRCTSPGASQRAVVVKVIDL